MNKSIIEKIALNESAHFNIQNFKNGYLIKLSDEYKRCFPEEVLNTNFFFINEVKKKFKNKIIIYKHKNDIFIKENKMIKEAKYKGKDVELNKPKRGDVKKFKVFVKDPKTKNIKKVNFGDKNMEIKRDDPERRKSFRARHKCDTAKDKTTPRYWSCKFWGKNPVSKLLNEIIQPNSIDVKKYAKKDQLNTNIWNNLIMNDQVRNSLLKITKEFIEFAKLGNLKFKDIILTGSLANYNWTDESDLDVHILMDFNQISDDKELIGDYLKDKKNIWNEKLPIKVKNHDVEMYVQDINEPHTSTGIYSIISNEWKTKPIKEMIQLDIGNIQLKAADLMNFIDELGDNENKITSVNQIQKILDKLKKMRKCGLENEGEFSTENIVFKILRNNGYLTKLHDLKNQILTKELTLENISMYTGGSSRKGHIAESKIGDIIKKAKTTGMLTLGLVVGLIASDISINELKKYGIPEELIEKAEEFIEKSIEPAFNNISNNF